MTGSTEDVNRPRADAARTYDRLSRVYDATEGMFERALQDRGLVALAAQPGEKVLEIGFGTGRCLTSIARSVGTAGHVAGIDISEGMRRVASRKLRRERLAARVDLHTGDAVSLPFADGSFDAVFTTFCLELFSSRDIPTVLSECWRVLRPGGRLVVVSLSVPDRPTPITRAYLWAHRHFPRLVDCRPIPVLKHLRSAGFSPEQATYRLFGLPVTIAIAPVPNHPGAGCQAGRPRSGPRLVAQPWLRS